MGLRSRLGIESGGMFFFAMFYLVVGILNFVVLGLYDLGLFHVTLVGVLSFVAAFGLYRLQKWSLWFVVGLLFIATTYIGTMLNVALSSFAANALTGDLVAALVWVLYLVFTWIATIYVVAARSRLK